MRFIYIYIYMYVCIYLEITKYLCGEVDGKLKHGTSIAQYDVLILCFINGSMLYLIGVYFSNYTLLST